MRRKATSIRVPVQLAKGSLSPKSQAKKTRNLKALTPNSYTLSPNPKPQTPKPQALTLNPKLLNPKLNRKPETLKP